jgi:hypothetical protein
VERSRVVWKRGALPRAKPSCSTYISKETISQKWRHNLVSSTAKARNNSQGGLRGRRGQRCHSNSRSTMLHVYMHRSVLWITVLSHYRYIRQNQYKKRKNDTRSRASCSTSRSRHGFVTTVTTDSASLFTRPQAGFTQALSLSCR